MPELLITMMKLPDKLKLGGRVVLSCSYFNPLPSKWEPFIEKFGLNFEFGMGENPKINVVISTSEDFENININISEQMVIFFKKCYFVNFFNSLLFFIQQV